MLAREFILSAFSTKPNLPGSSTGTLVGGGTPGGDATILARSSFSLFSAIARLKSAMTSSTMPSALTVVDLTRVNEARAGAFAATRRLEPASLRWFDIGRMNRVSTRGTIRDDVACRDVRRGRGEGARRRPSVRRAYPLFIS